MADGVGGAGGPLVACWGCGALVPEIDGPTHRYIGASPGCWELHGEVMLREIEPQFSRLSQLTVDTYAVQHPGVDVPQARQSVAVHLMSICLQVERGARQEEATRMLQVVLPSKNRPVFPWLEPPASRGAVTVLDVLAAEGVEAHLAAVRHWAESVWAAWDAYHPQVREWLARYYRG